MELVRMLIQSHEYYSSAWVPDLTDAETMGFEVISMEQESDEESTQSESSVIGRDVLSANSVDSVDSVFGDGPQVAPPAQKPGDDGWKKRGSMRAALTEDSRSVSSLSDDGEGQVVRTVESEKLHMRKWVVTSILDSEQSYIAMLGVLLQYMRSLEASARSSQPVISEAEVNTIFYNIPELHRIHSQFVNSLEPIVENWSNASSVGAVYKILALEEYPLANAYCQNYQKATACLQRCSEMHPTFHELVQKITCKGQSQSQSETLEEMLHKPVVRVQRTTLVLHDLIKFTPTSHSDYDILQKTLKITQQFLENFQTPIDPDNTENQRYLVKNGMIVEMERNRRKLRQVFLFNDVLVIAKQKLSRQRLHFECKVFIPLVDLLIEASHSKEDSKMAAGQKDKVEKLKKRVSELQAEMRAEVRKNQGQAEGRQWSMRGGRNLEKIRKKLTEQEVELFRESPNLVFRLRTKNKKDKPVTLLMSSDYERTDWRETITGLQIKPNPGANSQGLTLVDLQNLINSIQRPKINVIGAADGHDVAMEEEHVYGSLSVTVNRIQGLKVKADTFCCIEVDSYGHFFMKAKTNIISSSSEPKWNEEFEIDLDGAQTLRMLAYKMEGDSDILLGRGALELSKAWLKGRYQDTTVSLNEELSLTVSMKYTSREQTLKRTPSSAKGGLFGVKISSVTKRESRQVPLIVTTCVEEIERRGLDDLGIYRISGLSSEIQRLKKAFERNVKGAIPLARETDTHVLACLLKLYFRELPEALFTDKLYPNFVEGLNLSEPEAKERCMMSLLQSLPEPNYTTIVYLLEHMMTISKNEGKNKMSINNLATVFGPTLLRPAVTNDEPLSLDMFSAGARDAMLQTGILLYFMNLKKAGVDFEKHQ